MTSGTQLWKDSEAIDDVLFAITEPLGKGTVPLQECVRILKQECWLETVGDVRMAIGDTSTWNSICLPVKVKLLLKHALASGSPACHTCGKPWTFEERTDKQSQALAESLKVDTIKSPQETSVSGEVRGGWYKLLDEATGHYYYYQEETGKSQWLPPREFQAEDKEASAEVSGALSAKTQEASPPKKSPPKVKAKPECNLCGSKFSLVRLRHQCRGCAQFVCGDCSQIRLPVFSDTFPNPRKKKVRACLDCAETYREQHRSEEGEEEEDEEEEGEEEGETVAGGSFYQAGDSSATANIGQPAESKTSPESPPAYSQPSNVCPPDSMTSNASWTCPTCTLRNESAKYPTSCSLCGTFRFQTQQNTAPSPPAHNHNGLSPTSSSPTGTGGLKTGTSLLSLSLGNHGPVVHAVPAMALGMSGGGYLDIPSSSPPPLNSNITRSPPRPATNPLYPSLPPLSDFPAPISTTASSLYTSSYENQKQNTSPYKSTGYEQHSAVLLRQGELAAYQPSEQHKYVRPPPTAPPPEHLSNLPPYYR